jgi:ATP-dependent helicase HrpB
MMRHVDPASFLPVEQILPQLLNALAGAAQVVLQAPPGAGKTTRVPLVLMNASWMSGKKMILLEPRRLAARYAAQFMAEQLGETVGQQVGFRTRLETRVSAETRIEVVTEGILTRMLQSDPFLEGVGGLIFDEFHERNLQGDLGLALALESQSVFREDLKILVMSATLDTEGLQKILPDAPVIVSDGRAFPVSCHYARQTANQPDIQQIAATLQRALEETSGDLLVFLPGVGEIVTLMSVLGAPQGCWVLPLYGDLPPAEQESVFQKTPAGQRKIVLATAIAESSLTLDGVRVVVDSGWMRVPRFDPRSGMTRLETVRVSRASADQRAGRAGRQGPGACYRCWTEETQARLRAYTAPEILEADLMPLVLELAIWGAQNPASLNWITSPPDAGVMSAKEVLQQLGALDQHGRITAHGRKMGELGMHPRLAHMVLRAREWGCESCALALAALLSERDVVRGRGGQREADLVDRVRWLLDNRPLEGTDSRTRERLRQIAKRWKRGNLERCQDPDEWTGRLVAQAYPDRLAQCRENGRERYLLRNGRGAILQQGDSLVGQNLLAIAALDGAAREARIFLAASLGKTELERDFADQIETVVRIEWDERSECVIADERRQLGALTLQETVLKDPDSEAVQQAFLTGIARRGVSALPWTEASLRLRHRMRFVRSLPGEERAWPDWSDEGLRDALPDWLGGWLQGMSRLTHLERLDMCAILNAQLRWDQKTALDELAPEKIKVPSGSWVAIDYTQPSEPVLAVKLQEVFRWTETPRIGGGRVPLLMHLLSPARRPVQITRDLAGFWSGSYHEVKKELKGRYPKHPWPDNPLEAQATRFTKQRSTPQK